MLPNYYRCISLRTGCITMAILGILGPVWHHAFGNQESLTPSVMVIINLIFNGCLLFGAIQYNKIATIIFLILDLILTVLLFLDAIFVFLFVAAIRNQRANKQFFELCKMNPAACLGNSSPSGWKLLFSTCANVSVWICAFCFVKQIKLRKKNDITTAAWFSHWFLNYFNIIEFVQCRFITYVLLFTMCNKYRRIKYKKYIHFFVFNYEQIMDYTTQPYW